MSSRASEVAINRSAKGMVVSEQRAVLAEIARCEGAALLRSALRLTRQRDDAWDLLQDAFERALCGRAADVQAGRMPPWLRTTMRNLATDRRRALRRRPHTTLVDDMLPVDPNVDEEPQPTWRSIDSAEVRRCCERLDPRLREAFELKADRGFSLAEVAAQLGVPQATVGTRVHRARRRLRELLLSASSER